MRSPWLAPVDDFRLSSSSIQSFRSMRDVFRPRLGGEGEGEGFEGVRTTGGGSLAAVAADSGESMSDGDEGSSSALSLRCEVAPPARDSKAAIRDWRAGIVAVAVQGQCALLGNQLCFSTNVHNLGALRRC